MITALGRAHATGADTPPAVAAADLAALDASIAACDGGVEFDEYDRANMHLARARLLRFNEQGTAAKGEAVAALAHARAAGAGTDEQIMLAHCLLAVANSEREQGRFRPARSLLDEALRVACQVSLGTVEMVDVLNALGVWARYYGDLGEARSWYSRARALLEDAGTSSAVAACAAAVAHNLASLEQLAGNAEAALGWIDEAIERRGASDDLECGLTGDLGVRAVVLTDLGRYVEARRTYALLGVRLTASHGADSVELMYLHANAAVLEERAGHLERALELSETALTAARRALGDDHPQVGVIEANLSQLELERGRHESAAVHAKAALDILAGVVSGDLPSLRLARRVLDALAS